jgi:tyrosyl-tRNA synthetase
MINPFTGGLEFPKEIENHDKLSLEGIGKLDINKAFDPVPSILPVEERIKIIKSVGEEIIQESEIEDLLKRVQMPICYDGFEPSGRMHIAQGIMRTINVNKLIKAGCQFTFWVADWFAMLNNKMGGDIEKIRTVGRYFVEIWRAAGMDLRNVKFLWASDEITKHSEEYWSIVIDIARKNTLERITRCGQIMGRSDKDQQMASQIIYPCMQCADVFFLKADICQLGMDQRKVNMLAREYSDDIKKKDKPIIISHHMLAGLTNQKMSKSDPDSAIFMEDSKEEVERKIKKAVCPPKSLEENPIWDYVKSIIWEAKGFFYLKRRDGEDTKYTSLEQLGKDYVDEKIHFGDLKMSVAAHINELLEPVRRHFEEDPYAKKLFELVKTFKVTK